MSQDTNITTSLWHWFKIKELISRKENHIFVNEREICFISIGYNIGCEQNGKHKHFERPVLVLRKFGKNLFIGIPLSTKLNGGKYYFNFKFASQNSCALLSQIRLFDTKRVLRKIGYIDKANFLELKNKLALLLGF